MRTARWSSGLFLILVLALSGGLLLTSRPIKNQDSTQPDQGVLSPTLDPSPLRTPVARVDADLGRILDLEAVGGNIAILAREGWVLTGEGALVTWTRDRSVGSPDWLSRPVSIAAGFGSVFVLDAGRGLVSVWDSLGSRLPDLSLPRGHSVNFRPARVLVGPKGRPMVTLQKIDEGGTASWALLGLQANGQALDLLSLPNASQHMVFEEPLLAFSESALFGVDPLTQQLFLFDLAQGRTTPIAARVDPPFWLVPKRQRREYQEMLADLGGASAALSQLPEFWPSVRDFTVDEAGCVLLAISAGEDRQHIEILTGEMEPLGRFSPNGFDQAIFLSQGRAFVAEESLEETVIYEFRTEVCRTP